MIFIQRASYTLILGSILTLSLMGCKENKMSPDAANPFFNNYNTPHNIPPFGAIKPEHYRPAFDVGIKEQWTEVKRISENPVEATFTNTIEALEYSGKLLTRVSNVFENLTGSNSSEQLRALEEEIRPKLTTHYDKIQTYEPLFKRIEYLYKLREQLNLDVSQMKLLVDTYESFVRNGAKLNTEQKETLLDLSQQISKLSNQFTQNLNNDRENFALVINDEKDLAGLPEEVKDMAKQMSTNRGQPEAWMFSTLRSSFTPFMTFAQNRELRQKLFEAYTSMGNRGNEYDNKNIVAKIASLRVQKAKLLGFPTHAHYRLQAQMSKTPQKVYELLDQVWTPALTKAKEERDRLETLAKQDNPDFKLEAWDWWYYAEKIRQQEYDLDQAETRPYFSVKSTLKGAFLVAKKLFGIEFERIQDVPVYHPDVQAYKVTGADNELLGIYFFDPYFREGKRDGAWMNVFRGQKKEDGQEIRPIVVNVMNFPKAANGEPSLLTIEEASTLFHEFGHALHGLAAQGTYPSQTGTNVPRDFVEFPSQFYENWIFHPESVKLFAKHYETGETIPDALLQKMDRVKKFNKGFETVEYMAASYLDLNWHTLEDSKLKETETFEKESLDKLGLIKEIAPRYRSTYFAHAFSWGYSAGYYSYLWSERLDADAFEAFTEGPFDEKMAKKYFDEILTKGGTRDPMVSYRKFKGGDPSIDALLRRKGLKTER